MFYLLLVFYKKKFVSYDNYPYIIIGEREGETNPRDLEEYLMG